MGHDEDAKVKLEHGGKQGEGQSASADGKQVPQNLNDDGLGQHLLGLDHDAELQHQLRGALQEGLEQTQHADIGALKHHAPVVVSALGVSVPAALHTQIQGVDIPTLLTSADFPTPPDPSTTSLYSRMVGNFTGQHKGLRRDGGKKTAPLTKWIHV
ncbi:hypothetical protein EYF80_016468 [Liparis tanakae]|uniref:Uncharacterized protein n=1 Tax=Liparis tanakae TaxID=230148 RepID=A0A4Z2I773_9TELE|nr:hypothetical protein EYF80_016468 [Liparis tanakae]